MAILSKALLLWASARAVSASCAHGTSLQPRQEGGAVEIKTFGYAGAIGPAFWSTLAPENGACSTGTRQSPIDMVAGAFTEAPASSINLQIANIAEAEFENLGTTIEVVPVNPAVLGTAEIGGQQFQLQQFHFHLPSEHLDNGTSNAMEMHMVFESNGTIAVVGSYINVAMGAAAGVAAGAEAGVARRHARDVSAKVEKRQQQPCRDLTAAIASALGMGPPCGGASNVPSTGANGAQIIAAGPGGSQIIGGGQTVGAAQPGAGQTIGVGAGAEAGAEAGAGQGGSAVLNQILAEAPKINTPGTKTKLENLNMEALVASINAGNLQQYDGSLTTPPCSEGVKWNVATTKQEISMESFALAREAIGFNARFAQNSLGQPNALSAAAAVAGGAAAAPAPVASPAAEPAAAEPARGQQQSEREEEEEEEEDDD